jgi:hypothetical protein
LKTLGQWIAFSKSTKSSEKCFPLLKSIKKFRLFFCILTPLHIPLCCENHIHALLLPLFMVSVTTITITTISSSMPPPLPLLHFHTTSFSITIVVTTITSITITSTFNLNISYTIQMLIIIFGLFSKSLLTIKYRKTSHSFSSKIH